MKNRVKPLLRIAKMYKTGALWVPSWFTSNWCGHFSYCYT